MTVMRRVIVPGSASLGAEIERSPVAEPWTSVMEELVNVCSTPAGCIANKVRLSNSVTSSQTLFHVKKNVGAIHQLQTNKETICIPL